MTLSRRIAREDWGSSQEDRTLWLQGAKGQRTWVAADAELASALSTQEPGDYSSNRRIA
jgi:hypothetical protein